MSLLLELKLVELFFEARVMLFQELPHGLARRALDPVGAKCVPSTRNACSEVDLLFFVVCLLLVFAIIVFRCASVSGVKLR